MLWSWGYTKLAWKKVQEGGRAPNTSLPSSKNEANRNSILFLRSILISWFAIIHSDIADSSAAGTFVAHQKIYQTVSPHRHQCERHWFDWDKGAAELKPIGLKYFVDAKLTPYCLLLVDNFPMIAALVRKSGRQTICRKTYYVWPWGGGPSCFQVTNAMSVSVCAGPVVQGKNSLPETMVLRAFNTNGAIYAQ